MKDNLNCLENYIEEVFYSTQFKEIKIKHLCTRVKESCARKEL